MTADQPSSLPTNRQLNPLMTANVPAVCLIYTQSNARSEPCQYAIGSYRGHSIESDRRGSRARSNRTESDRLALFKIHS